MSDCSCNQVLTDPAAHGSLKKIGRTTDSNAPMENFVEIYQCDICSSLWSWSVIESGLGQFQGTMNRVKKTETP